MFIAEFLLASAAASLVTVFAAIKKSDEIVVIRKASDIVMDDWYCRQHNKWNWAGDECNCCSFED